MIRLKATTGRGKVEAASIAPVLAATVDDVGLSLAEAKSLMAKLQEAMVREQMAQYLHCRRVYSGRITFLFRNDRCQRRLRILFGIVDVEAPRCRIYRCCLPSCIDHVIISSVSELLPCRCTNSSTCGRRWERAPRSAWAPGTWRCCCLNSQPAMSVSIIGSIPLLGSSRRPTQRGLPQDWGQAAVTVGGRASFASPNFCSRAEPNLPLRTVQRVCSRRSAPRRVQRVCCNLFIRRFTRKLVTPSVIAVPTRNPARWRSVSLTSQSLWPAR
jgi:hypothetical protein